MNENDTILQLRSKLGNIIPNIIDVWNIYGQEMSNNQLLNDIVWNKLIVRCEDSPNDSFTQCSDCHDKYLWEYLKPGFYPIFLPRNIQDESTINPLLDNLPTDLLDFDLSGIPIGLVNCHLLFCKVISDWIVDAIMATTNADSERGVRYEYSGYIICIIFQYMQQRINCNSNPKTSIKSILLNSNEFDRTDIFKWFQTIYFFRLGSFGEFGYALNSPEYDQTDVFKWFKTSNVFRLGSFGEFEYALNETVIKLKSRGRHYKLETTSEVSTVLDAKKSISCQYGVPVQYLLCINYGKSSIKPMDDDLYNNNLCIEIMLSAENIEIKELLGCGASGEVYLCETLNTKLALKMPKSTEDLYREIYNCCQLLRCKKILGYKELYCIDNRPCMAMKYLKGGSLASHLEKGFSEAEIAKISRNILSQIAEIHQRKFIHFDIKCGNVVLSESKCAKIIDFGVSEYNSKSKKGYLLKHKIGTELYMAPEIINKENCSCKVDIWSFGVMLTEMVSSNGLKLLINYRLFTRNLLRSGAGGLW